MTRTEYDESQKDAERIRATDNGKRAVRDFVDAFNRRQRADRRYTAAKKDCELDTESRYASAAYFFFKWLAEIPEFDRMNTPIFNVPIITVWQQWNGKIHYIHNILSQRNAVVHRRFRALLRFVLRCMRPRRGERIRQRASRPFGMLNDLLLLKLSQLNKRLKLADEYFVWADGYTKHLDALLAKRERERRKK